MKLFFDTRLGYLVAAPGTSDPLTTMVAKAGDTLPIDIEFGASADPSGSPSFIEANTWTAAALPGSTVITIGIKESGDYFDGTLLAGTSTSTYSNPVYQFELDLDNTPIDTALSRDDADDTNDVASLACIFEVTYQEGGTGGWISSSYPVEFTLYHDLLAGAETAPT